MKSMFALAALALLSACATSDSRGWTGSGAEPFDAAQADCRAQSQGQGEAAFEACMAGKGWTRP